MKHQPHKNECRGGVRQVVKTITKITIDFIASTARYASADSGYLVLCAVLAVQFVAMFGGVF